MIYLIRHGETPLNYEKKFYGKLDVSLNQKGINQSLELQRKLSDISFTKVYTSDLNRTIETALLVTKIDEHSLIKMNKLSEKGFGLWEGLTANEIQEHYPNEWQSWLDEPFKVTPPEAEAFFSFKERVESGFCEILDSYKQHPEEDILVVAHLGVLRLVWQFIKPETCFWDIDIPQGTYAKITTSLKEIILEES
ncbi:histidine phosphatase family protein [Vagococcus fessus]|nr:histidine phosphatase family protein [Vagococcus fessus]